MITIVVNGKERTIDESMSLFALLEFLDIRREGVAVAVNTDVIPKKKYETVFVSEGDSVEIVRAVQGG